MRRCVFFTVLLVCTVLVSSQDSSGSTPVTPMESTTISESPTPTGSTHTAPGTSSGTTSVPALEDSSGSTPVTAVESTTISESPTPTGSTDSAPGSSSTSPTQTSTEDSSGSTPVTPMESTTISESPTPTGSIHTAPGTSSGTTSVPALEGSTPVTPVGNTTISEPPTPTDSSGSTPVTPVNNTTISDSPTPTENTSTVPESSSTDSTVTPTYGSTHTAPGTSSDTTSVPALEDSSGNTPVTPVNNTTISDSPDTGKLCKPYTCGGLFSTCFPLNTTHTCLCPYGFYYFSNNCLVGKVFPGTITLKGQFSSNITIGSSLEYEEMFLNITEFFKSAFANMADYRQTVIVKVNYIGEATRTRSNNVVNVTLMNIFTANTNETTETIDKAVTEAIGNLGYVSQYTNTSQCAVYNCDDMTTECEEDPHPTCVCKPDFEKTAWDFHSCSSCSNCSAKENKFCETQNGLPTCKCMSNFKKGEDNKCVSCPVGYSGDNCENNKELILIIVGTVLGAVILCLVVAVSVVSIRAKGSHDPEKKRLIKPRDYHSNTSDDVRIFPRVQTTSGHANPGYQPNNPYEAHSTNRGDFGEKDYDDLYEITRQPEGFRMQRR